MNDDLKNEIMDLKEIVRSVHSTVVVTQERLETVETNLNTKIDNLDKKFEGKFDSLNQKMMQGFEAMDRKIDSVQEGVHGISQRMQGIENRADRLNERVLDELYPVKEKSKELEKRMFAVEKFQVA